ncbi:uncharacterized protein L203_104832 [Cryptococcus depauperatus CBS 7841]|uniref:Uncharacterized protein n=1 Tax=Cryptococcus depauperatus CBS 7841 TaxID=1295531 RepID=A0A1E3IQQ5_9TREE|nr:hypothetical protein L203_01961 [Cryptococcus depauperatus CBS 7841]
MGNIEKEKEHEREGRSNREKETQKLKHDDRSQSRSPSLRRRDKDRSRHRDRRSRSKRRHSYSDSDPSSSSDGSESEERRRKKKREKERQREREDREERRKRKKEKRARKEQKKTKTSISWGKYGIISDLDMSKKDTEFRAWLVEERKINLETVKKEVLKKEFATFVEDYNTATLPHEKYYDMNKYIIKLNMIRTGGSLPDDTGGYDPTADMKAHSSSLKKTAKESQIHLTPMEVAELRKIEAERIEISKRRLLGMNVPKHMGVRTEEADY